MSKRLHVAPRPCSTCPYRRDTPAGVWDACEYEKLRAYDANPGPFAAFHCHQEHTSGIPTICRGWLGVHPDTLAVRVLQMMGCISPEDVPVDPDPTLYASGAEACAAGLAGVPAPSPGAKQAIRKIVLNRRRGQKRT